MMKYIVGIFLFALSSSAFAHHIVGGDLTIQVINAQTYEYKITLTFLFDQVNGSPEAEDAFEIVSLFDKSSNVLLQTFLLDKVSNNTYLPYTSASCNTAELKTRIIIYQTVVVLSPDIYNQSTGYYMAWERCCRSDDLLNILNPSLSGVVFYEEFSAVQKNGKRFIDSSPAFIHLKGDYACTNTYYLLDFSASDADGDSLAYALLAPIKGYSTADDPAPLTADPGPYPSVDFSSGISAQDMIPGPMGITIDSHTGMVKGIASTAGLYVFAVACSEYRNHQKIGEIRRDYVFYVKGDCPHYTTPEIGLQEGATHYVHQTDTIVLHDTRLDLLHLYAVDSSDNDITIQLIPENFSLNALTYSALTGLVHSIQDTVRATVQWYDCGFNPEPYYKLYAVASKYACPVPTYDTLEILFKIDPPVNAFPVVSTSLLHDSASIYQDEPLLFHVFANDADGDELTLSRIKTLGFKGGAFNDTSGYPPLQSVYSWTPHCEDFHNAGPHRLYFMTQDNSCYRHHTDTVVVNVKIKQQAVDLSILSFYNLATPNGDHRNDGLIIPNLPADNCDEQFKSVAVYNRYGACVFYSTERVHEISVEHLSDGVYYYAVAYSTQNYKGWFEIIR